MADCPHCRITTVADEIAETDGEQAAMAALVEALADRILAGSADMDDAVISIGPVIWNLQVEISNRAGEMADAGDLRFIEPLGEA